EASASTSDLYRDPASRAVEAAGRGRAIPDAALQAHARSKVNHQLRLRIGNKERIVVVIRGSIRVARRDDYGAAVAAARIDVDALAVVAVVVVAVNRATTPQRVQTEADDLAAQRPPLDH